MVPSKNLLAWFFIHTIGKSDKPSLFPRTFLFFARFALTRTFFYSPFLSGKRVKKGYARKKKPRSFLTSKKSAEKLFCLKTPGS